MSTPARKVRPAPQCPAASPQQCCARRPRIVAPESRKGDPQRLIRDFKRLQGDDRPAGVNGAPNPDNIMHWNAVIFGPEDTSWDGGAPLSPSLPIQSAPCCSKFADVRAQCGVKLGSDWRVSWRAGTFKLTLEFSEDYPNKAPVVKFMSTMFHPNSTPAPITVVSPSPGERLWCPWSAVHSIEYHQCTSCCAVYADGGICLDILQNQWSPIYDVAAILTSIQVCPGQSWRTLRIYIYIKD